jgi:hypothetical protein
MSDSTSSPSRTARDEIRNYEVVFGDDAHSAGQGSGLPEPDPKGDPEVELVKRAAEVLGVEQMVRWMKMRIPSLHHQTPLSLMGTEAGREEVARVLTQIEHGVF